MLYRIFWYSNLHGDIRIYMAPKSWNIEYALFPDLHVFRNIPISAIFEYTWFSYHIYSIIYGTKTMYIRKYMMAWHVISNMEIGIFDIYFSHTIEYRICSSLFFWIFGNIYSIFDDIPYHRKSNITIENRISGYSILAATDQRAFWQPTPLMHWTELYRLPGLHRTCRWLCKPGLHC